MKKLLLMLLLAMCCMASGWAQPYRVNRQRLRIEGVTFAKRAQVSDQNYLYMADFAIKPGETKVVPIYLSNTLPMWMFQCDLELPAGLTATDADFSSAMSSSTMSGQYSLATGNVDGCFRMLVYNQSKTKSIPTGTQFHILNVTIKASANLTPNQTLTATIKNFDFIDANSDEGITGANKSCTVTVNPILVSSISLSKTSVTLQPGGTLQLTASISPSNATNKNVTWSSSNTSVATVTSAGKVTAKVPGTATITAKTADGSNLTATCTVTVTPAKGDLNEDGKVDRADYTLLVTRIADQAVYNSKFDLDGNGQVDVLDANWLLDVIGN